MTRGGELALAVTMGYVLGRKRRMRWALALGTAAAAGRLSSGRGGLMGRLSNLSVSPGLGRLLKAGRPLVSAGGAAARTAVGGRIDSAADRLQQTAQRLRTTGREDADTDTADTDTGTETAAETSRADKPRTRDRDKPRAGKQSYRGDEDDDRFADDEYDDREGDDDVDEPETDEGDDDEGDDDERAEDERDEPKGRRRADTPRPPVRRRGR